MSREKRKKKKRENKTRTQERGNQSEVSRGGWGKCTRRFGRFAFGEAVKEHGMQAQVKAAALTKQTHDGNGKPESNATKSIRKSRPSAASGSYFIKRKKNLFQPDQIFSAVSVAQLAKGPSRFFFVVFLHLSPFCNSHCYCNSSQSTISDLCASTLKKKKREAHQKYKNKVDLRKVRE